MPIDSLPRQRSTEDRQQLNLHMDCEVTVTMRPDTSCWRENATYDVVDDLPPDGLAWEYLRRNGAYQQDFARHLEIKGLAEPLAADAETRWGLRFRGKAEPFLLGSTHSLVSQRGYGRRHSSDSARLSDLVSSSPQCLSRQRRYGPGLSRDSHD